MWSRRLKLLLTIALLVPDFVSSWNSAGNSRLSRRSVFRRVIETASAVAVTPLLLPSSNPALAAIEGATNARPSSFFADNAASPERQALLSAIESGASDATVLSALETLVGQDPSNGRGASASLLDGQWKLLWSAKAEAFSPLLQLPVPLKPSSYQYIGEPASKQVGAGRIAQMLTGGVLGPLQLWLSSGVEERSDNPAMLEIKPPFRLEVVPEASTSSSNSSPKQKTLLVQAGTDADFRAVNARTVEAQQAPPNQYQQIYVEEGPKALRISTIVEGDPVIVGAVFIHQKV